MSTVIVEVMPKAVLLDPQGKAVAGALQRIGHTNVTDVRVGKRFEIIIDGPVDDEIAATLAKVAEDVLSNSVIEDVTSLRVIGGGCGCGSKCQCGNGCSCDTEVSGPSESVVK